VFNRKRSEQMCRAAVYKGKINTHVFKHSSRIQPLKDNESGFFYNAVHGTSCTTCINPIFTVVRMGYRKRAKYLADFALM